MPDPNKLKALSDAGFQVRRTCLRCAFYDAGRKGWGTCQKIPYTHQKHIGEERYASVPQDGYCNMHETWLEAEALLGAHRVFLEER